METAGSLFLRRRPRAWYVVKRTDTSCLLRATKTQNVVNGALTCVDASFSFQFRLATKTSMALVGGIAVNVESISSIAFGSEYAHAGSRRKHKDFGRLWL